MPGQSVRGRGGLQARPFPPSASGGESSRKRPLPGQTENQSGPSSFARNMRPRSGPNSPQGSDVGDGRDAAGGIMGSHGVHPNLSNGAGVGGGIQSPGQSGVSLEAGGPPQRGVPAGGGRGGDSQARGRGHGAGRGGRGRSARGGIPPPFRPPGVRSGTSGLGGPSYTQGGLPSAQSHHIDVVDSRSKATAGQIPIPPPTQAVIKAKPTRKADSETPPAFPDPALVNNLVVAYMDSLRHAPAPSTHPNPPRKKAPQVTYEYEADPAEPTLVKCTIRLPAESNAIRKVFVSAPAEKTAARKLAAADVMHELWRAGDVDDSYRAESYGTAPVPIAVSDSIRVFPAKTPDFFDACEAILAKGPLENSRTWHPTLVTLPPLLPDLDESNASPLRPLRPLIMLTPLPLPRFSAQTPLRLFQPHMTKPSPVDLKALPPITLSTTEHAMADHYTRRLFRSILNRPILLEEGRLLVHLFLPPTETLDGVNWVEVVEAQGEAYEPWPSHDLDTLKLQATDAMTTGKNEFSRRYEVKAVRPDLSPLSSPDDSPREKGFPSIIDYIRSTSSREVYLSNETQPLLEMRKLPVVKSHLRSILPPASDELSEGVPPRKVIHEQKYIIPEFSYRSTLRFSAYRSALYLPSFLTQLSTLLKVFELKAGLFGSTMREDVLLRSLTTPNAHREEDYDKLEYSGDVVLKCLTSVYIYVMAPHANESEMTLRRVSLVNNKFLTQRLVESGLTHYLVASEHSPKVWYPHNMGRWETDGSSKTSNLNADAVRDSKLIKVGDKVCADVVEALIYAAYETGGLSAAWTFCRIVKLPMPEIAAWTDFATRPVALVAVAYPPAVIEAADDIASRLLKYTFKKPQLLQAALMREAGNRANFQRLEYLGDAVLDLMAVTYLHKRLPDASVGEMVLFKSNIVSNVALSALCVDLGLHQALSVEQPQIWLPVERYAREVTNRKMQELKAAAAEKRPLKAYWADLDAPKAVGDLVEAVIGALMVDGGFSAVEPSRYFFDTVFKPFLEKFMSGMHSLPEQPAKILIQLVGARRCTGLDIRKPPRGRSNGPVKVSVVLHKVYIASAVADTENFAMRKATEQALTAIEADQGLLARLCDCNR